MKDRLAAFLASFEDKPVEWGRDDCTACPALWLRENGFDVRLPEYRSRDEAHALITAAGGLVPLWGQYLSGTGVGPRYGAPELGDIAIIETRLLGDVGVIVGAGGLCCWRKEGGFFWLAPRTYLQIWAVT